MRTAIVVRPVARFALAAQADDRSLPEIFAAVCRPAREIGQIASASFISGTEACSGRSYIEAQWSADAATPSLSDNPGVSRAGVFSDAASVAVVTPWVRGSRKGEDSDQPRSCGRVQSSSGPMGMMRCGFTMSWL